MATFASDNFDSGTPGADLSGRVATGGTWVEHGNYTAGTIVFSDVGRIRAGASGNNAYYLSANPPSADYDVECDVVRKSSDGSFGGGPAGRLTTSPFNGYHVRYNPDSGNWELFRVTGTTTGTFTSIGTYTQSLTADQAYNCRLRMVGDAISVYIDDVLRIGPVTDANITAKGVPGIRLNGSSSPSNTIGIHLDNFLADNTGAVPSTPRWTRYGGGIVAPRQKGWG
jgi:hypothetical protein